MQTTIAAAIAPLLQISCRKYKQAVWHYIIIFTLLENQNLFFVSWCKNNRKPCINFMGTTREFIFYTRFSFNFEPHNFVFL